MFYVYVLRSLARNYTYVGLTGDVQKRLHRTTQGLNRTTRAHRPFEVIRIETFSTRLAARRREKYLKSGVGKEFLKSLK